MRSLFIILSTAGMIACTSFNAQATNVFNAPVPAFPTSNDSTKLPQNYYKRFEGTIAGQPVVMQLQGQHRAAGGHYYYTKYGRYIDLYTPTDSSTTPDSLVFKESVRLKRNDYRYRNSGRQATLKLHYEYGTLSGRWINGETGKTQPVLLHEAYPSGTYRFTVFSYSDSLRAFPDSSNSPVAFISQEFVQALDTTQAATWFNKHIADTSSVQKRRTTFFTDYRNEVQSYKKLKTDFPSFLNYVSNSGLQIDFNAKGIVVLKKHHYQYLGGAHGMYNAVYYNVDLRNTKELALKDIVMADSLTLQHLLEKNFRKEYNIAPGDSLTSILFENKLPPNNNFYISPAGIGFIFNQYEVAPYAAGVINVLIPYNELSSYLKPAFKIRMDL